MTSNVVCHLTTRWRRLSSALPTSEFVHLTSDASSNLSQPHVAAASVGVQSIRQTPRGSSSREVFFTDQRHLRVGDVVKGGGGAVGNGVVRAQSVG
jgi:hypothetical protein